MTDVLTGRELDERVAKMMGWKEEDWGKHGHRWVFDDGDRHDFVPTFQSPDALYNIVLPWAREQGYHCQMLSYPSDSSGDWVYSTTFWKMHGTHPRGGGTAIRSDLIIAVENALVRASEATQ